MKRKVIRTTVSKTIFIQDHFVYQIAQRIFFKQLSKGHFKSACLINLLF